MNLDTILAELAALNREQLTEVRTRATMLLSTQGAVGGTPDSGDAELVLYCIQTFLQGAGLEFVHASQLKKAPQYSAFKDKIPGLFKYLRRSSRHKVEMTSLLNIGISLLYANLLEMQVPVSSRTIMAHIHRLPAVINRALPGYAQSGMLHKIVKKEVQYARQKNKIPKS